MLALVIEGLVMLGEQAEAGRLYPLAGELIDTGAVALWPIFRFAQTIAAVAATAALQWEAAEDHFQVALCIRPSPFPIASKKQRSAASAR